MIVIGVSCRILFRSWLTDFGAAQDNGWIGKQRSNLRLWAPPPDNTYRMDGYDETWSHAYWLDVDIVTAIKYDERGQVVASEQFFVDCDDPNNLIIDLYRPDAP
ncbi:MAG: hypothetical protein RBS39_11995 [Phycisphaerales bacterium]|jgi:hypothetical protein|nr:hypothetical protein [Phycisphaerales bacterium]